MNWRNVRLILLREVKDQLRDRRTLFMVAVLPLLLYPAMGIGMMQLNVLFREQPRVVAILGADQLPAEPKLLDGTHVASEWFAQGADPNRIVIISDHPGEATDTRLPHGLNHETLLKNAKEIREHLKTDRDHVGRMFGSSGLQVLIVIPEGFADSLTGARTALESRATDTELPMDYPRPEIVYNKADEKSQITYNRVSDILERWEVSLRDGWMKLAKLNPRITHPVDAEPVNVALEEQLAASVWGRLFPALLVIMSVTGAFYPAIDLVAGEKERGTMETLLICPATRSEIVLGKFFTVMLFSCTTALLNLISMGFTGRHIASMAPTAAMAQSGMSLPPLWAIAWILVLLLPLAALFSALCLALATFARSSKEGQYYLTPLLMVTLGLTMFCLSPGVELNPQYSLLPIAGVALLLKGLLLSPLHAGDLYAYVPAVLMSSIGYSALALWWAIDQFKREEVLFREAERFELRLWLRHLMRDKEPTPGFSEGAFCFVVIMMLQFFSLRFMQQKLALTRPELRPQLMMHLLLVQQMAIIASPALMMSLMLTTSVRRSLGLYWPGWSHLGAAAILPFALHPLAIETLARLHWLFGDLPAGAQEALAPMTDDSQPLWLVVLTFAMAPAFCEEIAFRGFILQGFSRAGRLILAIGLSSLAFGMMHMIPQQVFNTTLMGFVMGALAMRSRSLFPAILFHFLNNSLGILHGRLGAQWSDGVNGNLWITVNDGTLRYNWPTVILCLLVAIPLLRWTMKPLLAPRAPGERRVAGPTRIVPIPGTQAAASNGI